MQYNRKSSESFSISELQKNEGETQAQIEALNAYNQILHD
jgi:hypothetical protein